MADRVSLRINQLLYTNVVFILPIVTNFQVVEAYHDRLAIVKYNGFNTATEHCIKRRLNVPEADLLLLENRVYFDIYPGNWKISG